MIDVAALRTTLTWSQKQLAECLGCDQSMVARFEKDGRPPSRSVKRLLDRLHVLVEEKRALPGMPVSDVVILMTGRLQPAPASSRPLQPQSA